MIHTKRPRQPKFLIFQNNDGGATAIRVDQVHSVIIKKTNKSLGYSCTVYFIGDANKTFSIECSANGASQIMETLTGSRFVPSDI